MCGFIAQLIEQRTGIAEVTGSNPVEALTFSGFFFPIGEFAAMTIFTLFNLTIISISRVLRGSTTKLVAYPLNFTRL